MAEMFPGKLYRNGPYISYMYIIYVYHVYHVFPVTYSKNYQTVKYCGKPTNDIGDDVFMKTYLTGLEHLEYAIEPSPVRRQYKKLRLGDSLCTSRCMCIFNISLCIYIILYVHIPGTPAMSTILRFEF